MRTSSKYVTNADKDFKRTRKLTFSDVIMYTIGNTRSPLELEAERFSKHLTADEISAAALCKARQKINRRTATKLELVLIEKKWYNKKNESRI